MITLDPVQAALLRDATTEAVEVGGDRGTGKSTLAMAIAAQAVGQGRSCLLVGRSNVLDRPAQFRTLTQVHPVLFERAHADRDNGARAIASSEHEALGARAKLDPFGARTAMALLPRVRQVVRMHDLATSELDESSATHQTPSGEAYDLASVAVQDATRLADQLWSGNARAGRSLADVSQVLEGVATEAPADERIQSLVLLDDNQFELELGKFRIERRRERDEQLASAIVARLRRPIKAEKTVAEYRQHAERMAKVMADAVDLVRRHGNLQAAVQAAADSDGAKAIEYFIRMRPDEGAADALRQFQSGARDYQQDARSLEPLMRQFGSRTLQSMRQDGGGAGQVEDGPIALVQNIREARSAARSLRSRLAQLRSALSSELAERFEKAALEAALSVLDQAASPTARERAIEEARQLRRLFTQTGFGDPLAVPQDFEARLDRILSRAPVAENLASRPVGHHAAVLDLLLDIDGYEVCGLADAWPSSLVRARTAEDVANIVGSGRKFDVVVADDAEEFASDAAALAACAGLFHRIGHKADDAAASLSTPHLQADAELSEVASGRSGRWLGAPDGVGILVRTAPQLERRHLELLAARLAETLRSSGFDAATRAEERVPDVLVASAGELGDDDLRSLASAARKGLVVLCRSDRRTPRERRQEGDLLGWRVVLSTIEGSIVEKDGRRAAIVHEPRVVDDRTDFTVSDRVSRIASLGWRPIVSWDGSDRPTEEYARLLEEQSVGRDDMVRSIVESFVLAPPPPQPGGDDREIDDVLDASELPPSSAEEHVAPSPLLQAAPEPASVELPILVEAPVTALEAASTERLVTHVSVAPVSRVETPISKGPEAAQLRKLQVAPARLDRIQLRVDGRTTALPHIARLVASTALNTGYADPICIVLPSTERVAQFTAIAAALECAAVDYENARAQFIERYLKPGASVRSLPEGYVFSVGTKTKVLGTEGIYLGYADKETQVGDGRRLVPNDQLFWYEPTQRQLPKSNPTVKPKAPPPTKVDELAGIQCCGNSGLYTNRVVLVGARAEFDRVLEGLDMESAVPGDRKGWGRLADTFAWGTFDDSGKPIALSPEGAGGSPLVAIARDLFELERASLAATVEPGSQIILTDRLDMILKNVELANRVGERQRLIVFVDARRRADALLLRRHGWKVWEPSPNELVDEKDDPANRTGIPGLDRTRRSSLAEYRPAFTYMPKSNSHLASAYAKLGEISDILNAEVVLDDERFQAIGDAVRSAFFRASSWLASPKGENLHDFETVLRRLREERPHVTRILGRSAADALDAYVEDVENFALDCVDAGITPKGDALLQLAKGATNADRKQVLVTGSRQSREEADAFLAANGVDLQCRLASELSDGENFPDVISFSLLRRDMFDKFVDPWPSKAVVMAGYDFEVDIYQQRMRWRTAQKRRLEVDAAVRATLTALPSGAFGPAHIGAVGEETKNAVDEAAVDPIDRIRAVGRDGARPIRIRELEYGEQAEDAHIVRFVGRSWMPMASDYRPVCLLQTENDRSKSGVEYVEVADLKPGMRIIVREGGEKDVIRAVAQQGCGAERYNRLWQKASLWRDALHEWGTDPGRIARRLQDCGLQRHIVTLRSWVTNKNLIGPRSEDDVLAIARAFPSPQRTVLDWKECWTAISELRGLHLSAGMRLTDDLVSRCGRMLLEPSETETAVEFNLGTVWILEVAEVDTALRSCPGGIVNHVQWLNSEWQERVFDERLKVMAA